MYQDRPSSFFKAVNGASFNQVPLGQERRDLPEPLSTDHARADEEHFAELTEHRPLAAG